MGACVSCLKRGQECFSEEMTLELRPESQVRKSCEGRGTNISCRPGGGTNKARGGVGGAGKLHEQRVR